VLESQAPTVHEPPSSHSSGTNRRMSVVCPSTVSRITQVLSGQNGVYHPRTSMPSMPAALAASRPLSESS
jgi:hypothetical protein